MYIPRNSGAMNVAKKVIWATTVSKTFLVIVSHRRRNSEKASRRKIKKHSSIGMMTAIIFWCVAKIIFFLDTSHIVYWNWPISFRISGNHQRRSLDIGYCAETGVCEKLLSERWRRACLKYLYVDHLVDTRDSANWSMNNNELWQFLK